MYIMKFSTIVNNYGSPLNIILKGHSAQYGTTINQMGFSVTIPSRGDGVSSN